MSKLLRQNKIVEFVGKSGSCSIETLAKQFNVSAVTIRRDLQILADEGKVMRTHGGAAVSEPVTFEFRFRGRIQANQNAKIAIAKTAAEMVEDGQSVILGPGTTTLELAKKLRPKDGLTIITTSLPVASELQYCHHIEILLVGGFLQHGSPDLRGALAEQILESLHADVGFLGIDAIDTQGGVYNDLISMARLLSKEVEVCKKIYGIADHSKIGKKSLIRYSNLAEWNGLITDDNASKTDIRALERAGINVILAKS